MSNSAKVATAGEVDPSSPSLSEAQLSAFWAGIVSNRDAARRMAGRFVSPQSVDDVVSTAAIRFIESLQSPKKRAEFPKSDDEFRRRFLLIVRNHAIDCIRDGDGTERPIHSYWGVATEPVVGGHRIADRELDQVFARNDNGKYDAPARAELRVQDDVYLLRLILRWHLPDLPLMQARIILETFGRGRKRAEVAQRLGISVKTYDCHLQAAFHTLRQRLTQDADESKGVDRSLWYDRIEELRERYEAVRLRRASKKKAKVPTSRANVPTVKATAVKASAPLPHS